MIATSDIERMSTVERLQAIELLWTSISRTTDDVSSPEWHQDVLSVRKAEVDAGTASFLSVSELRSRLHRSGS